MFCKNCGNEVSEIASFCKNCGNAINKKKENKKVDDILEYQVKPFFCLPYKLIVTTIWTLGLTFLFCIQILGEFLNDGEFPSVPITVIMAIIIVMKLIIDKNQYGKYEYNLYTTKIEYKDGFFSLLEKEVKYKYIREVRMSQGVLQRIFNIGDIVFYTTASSSVGTSGSHHAGDNGIHIHCVQNVEEEYERIKAIVEKGTEE